MLRHLRLYLLAMCLLSGLMKKSLFC